MLYLSLHSEFLRARSGPVPYAGYDGLWTQGILAKYVAELAAERGVAYDRETNQHVAQSTYARRHQSHSWGPYTNTSGNYELVELARFSVGFRDVGKVRELTQWIASQLAPYVGGVNVRWLLRLVNTRDLTPNQIISNSLIAPGAACHQLPELDGYWYPWGDSLDPELPIPGGKTLLLMAELIDDTYPQVAGRLGGHTVSERSLEPVPGGIFGVA